MNRYRVTWSRSSWWTRIPNHDPWWKWERRFPGKHLGINHAQFRSSFKVLKVHDIFVPFWVAVPGAAWNLLWTGQGPQSFHVGNARGDEKRFWRLLGRSKEQREDHGMWYVARLTAHIASRLPYFDLIYLCIIFFCLLLFCLSFCFTSHFHGWVFCVVCL